MGLAGTKKKTRIGNDPRNTKWANDKSRFGMKYMTSLGWKQGEGLGLSAKNDGRSITSHIKISLKDDNSGIGAKKNIGGTGDDDCTGLDVFQQLLGRLNGNSDQVEKNLELQRKQKQDIIFNARFGMTFVKGEVLESTFDPKKLKKLSRKRKRLSDDEKSINTDKLENPETDKQIDKDAMKKLKKLKKENKKEHGDKKDRKKKKEKKVIKDAKEKDKKIRKSKEDKKIEKDLEKNNGLKASKKSKKTEKLKKSRKYKNNKDNDTDNDTENDADKDKNLEKASIENSNNDNNSNNKNDNKTPANTISPISTESPKSTSQISARFSHRRKYISSKRMSTLDDKALNEIFMIKT